VIANSLFVVYHKLHLLNSYPGLILAERELRGAVQHPGHGARSCSALPTDVLQAARVDGAHRMGARSSGSSCR